MDVTLHWDGEPSWDEKPPAAYLRESYGLSLNPCELCPMIPEVLRQVSPRAIDPETGEVIAGNLFEAAIPAATLRERLPAAQERARVRYDGAPWGEEQARAIEAFVELVERLEAEGRNPIIVACT